MNEQEHSRGLHPGSEQAPEYWQSSSDLMAGLLMMFVLLLTLALLAHSTLVEEREHKIDTLLGVRADIIQALQSEFGDKRIGIDIDPQTGAIRFPGGVLFDFDSTEISSVGRSYMKEFIPQYMGVILSERFRPHISEVIVEGHTDQSGTYLYNLDLSQRRAHSVVRYVLDPSFPHFPEKEYVADVITANGRSYSQPMLEGGRPNWEKSRRVDFKFRLKEDELIREIKSLLDE